jgi:hypothetical protein
MRYESFANIHAKHRGLAIQSTIGRLQNALAQIITNSLLAGNYIDYKRIPFDDMFFRFIQEKAFNTSVKYALYQMWLKVILQMTV